MKNLLKFSFRIVIIAALSLVVYSCEEEEPDTCSSELGDIGDRYNCDVPVMPQLCTVDGVDDHWILDDVEYPCTDPDCENIPQDLIDAILAKDGCSTKKAGDIEKINKELSERAKQIFAKLKLESSLCNN